MEDQKQSPVLSEKTKFAPADIFNPWDDDFVFSWDSEEYRVPSKQTVSFPKFLRNHCLKHMIDKAIKTEAFAIIKKGEAKGNQYKIKEGERLIESMYSNDTRKRYANQFSPGIVESPIEEGSQETPAEYEEKVKKLITKDPVDSNPASTPQKNVMKKIDPSVSHVNSGSPGAEME